MGFVLDTTDPTTPRPGIVCDNADCGKLVDGDGWVFSVAFFSTYLACSDKCLPAIVAQFGDDYGPRAGTAGTGRSRFATISPC